MSVHLGFHHIKNGAANPLSVVRALNRTAGVKFHVWYPGAIILGTTFYTAQVGAKDYKISLWRPGAVLATTTTVNLVGPGTFRVLFPSPYTVTEADMAGQDYGLHNTTTHFFIGVYETSAGDLTSVIGALGSYGPQPIVHASMYHTYHYNQNSNRIFWAGDGCPISQDVNENQAIDPYISVNVGTFARASTPYVYRWGANDPLVGAIAANATTGHRFSLHSTDAIVYGVRFYTAVAGAHTMRCRLYISNGPFVIPSSVAMVDVACSGPGTYDGLFAVPYAPTPAELGKVRHDWHVSVWETSGTWYTASTDNTQIYFGDRGSPGCWVGVVDQPEYWAPGDQYPSIVNHAHRYPLNPLVNNVV